MERVTIYKNIFDKTPHYITIDVALERIKSGKSKDKCLEIRQQLDKERANKLKCNLPSVCFSGEFTERKDECLKNHSGFICLDFDNVNVSEYKETLKAVILHFHKLYQTILILLLTQTSTNLMFGYMRSIPTHFGITHQIYISIIVIVKKYSK